MDAQRGVCRSLDDWLFLAPVGGAQSCVKLVHFAGMHAALPICIPCLRESMEGAYLWWDVREQQVKHEADAALREEPARLIVVYRRPDGCVDCAGRNEPVCMYVYK